MTPANCLYPLHKAVHNNSQNLWQCDLNYRGVSAPVAHMQNATCGRVDDAHTSGCCNCTALCFVTHINHAVNTQRARGCHCAAAIAAPLLLLGVAEAAHRPAFDHAWWTYRRVSTIFCCMAGQAVCRVC